jgi:hypothetical protein
VCLTTKVPQFVPKSKRIETDEKAEKPKEEFNPDDFEQLAQELTELSKNVQKIDLVINEFEKVKFHYSFIIFQFQFAISFSHYRCHCHFSLEG